MARSRNLRLEKRVEAGGVAGDLLEPSLSSLELFVDDEDSKMMKMPLPWTNGIQGNASEAS